jgi:hypothetical protein
MENFDVFTYRRLRRAIGYLCAGLPVVLVILSQFSFFNTHVQSSISHYYYTNLRDIFTGTLCAVGLFLIRYKGHGNASFWKNDNLLTNIAGFMAIGVALVPTSANDPSLRIPTIIPYHTEFLGGLHYGFAALLFGAFSILAINVFTLGQEKDDNVSVSLFNENHIYRFCGYSIILFVALVPVSNYFNLFKYSTLLFEGLALLVFGIAWLIKGRALGDKGKIGEKLYRESNIENTETVFEE